MKVLLEVLRFEERGAVDALQHLAGLVASPVGAGAGEQPEVLDLVGRRNVRSPAQVRERTVGVGRDRLTVGDLGQPLQLQRIVGEQLLGFGAGQLPSLEFEPGSRHLRHLLFDRLEILGRERLWHVEVVVESVLDRRSKPDTGVGIQFPDRRREHVSGRVTKRVQRVVILVGARDDRHGVAIGERPTEVPQFAADRDGNGRTGQTRADGGREVGTGRSGRKLLLGTVGKSHGNHLDAHRHTRRWQR